MFYPKIPGFVEKPLPSDVAWAVANGRAKLDDILPYLDPALGYLAECPWVASVKYDGCNVRAEWDGRSIRVAGRTNASRLQTEVQELLERTFLGKEETFRSLFGETTATLFMECYGGKVQGSAKRRLYTHMDGTPLLETLVGFDVAVDGRFIPRTTPSLSPVFEAFGVPVVRFIGERRRGDDPEDNALYPFEVIEAVAQYAEEGCADENGDFVEGFVIHPREELFRADGSRIIYKVKCKHFGANPNEYVRRDGEDEEE